MLNILPCISALVIYNQRVKYQIPKKSKELVLYLQQQDAVEFV